MRGYQARADRQTSGSAGQQSDMHVAGRVNAAAGAGVEPLKAGERTMSLLQLQHALDGSPSVRAQVALQRALDKRAEAPPAKKKPTREKPALQMKGIAINDNAGLEREATVMGARASAMPAMASRVLALMGRLRQWALDFFSPWDHAFHFIPGSFVLSP